jgi:glutathione synthase/RimK-type ligase-like ATP-grasp enzyme
MPVEADEGPIVAAFERAGVAAEWAVWDDPTVDWSRFGGVLIRTTWDYVDKIDRFRSWATEVDAATELWNPAAVVRWSSHKRYLPALAAVGVTVVPTWFVERSTTLDVGALPDDVGHGFVVKPAEAVGSIGLSRWGGDERGRRDAVTAAAALRADGDVLVQPLLPAITTEGEVSIVVVDGEVSHAVRKVPAPGDIRSQPEYGSFVEAVAVGDDHRSLARDAIAGAVELVGVDADDIVYARVDCVDHDGRPHLMELELIEPDLYVGYDDGAADRVVAAVARRLPT